MKCELDVKLLRNRYYLVDIVPTCRHVKTHFQFITIPMKMMLQDRTQKGDRNHPHKPFVRRLPPYNFTPLETQKR